MGSGSAHDTLLRRVVFEKCTDRAKARRMFGVRPRITAAGRPGAATAARRPVAVAGCARPRSCPRYPAWPLYRRRVPDLCLCRRRCLRLCLCRRSDDVRCCAAAVAEAAAAAAVDAGSPVPAAPVPG